MDLRHEILKEHSKKQRDIIVAWVGKSQRRFDQLFELFMKGEYRVVQRSAWPVGECVLQHPALIAKHFKSLLESLHRHETHIAVKRNVMRILSKIPIPKVYQGKLMTICLDLVNMPEEAVAVKAYALGALERLTEHYPDIIPELKLIVSQRMVDETAAYRSRARWILKLPELK